VKFNGNRTHNNIDAKYDKVNFHFVSSRTTWHVPNIPQENQLQPPRLHVRQSPVRQSVKPLVPVKVSRRSEDPSKAQSPLEKSRSIKRPLIF